MIVSPAGLGHTPQNEPGTPAKHGWSTRLSCSRHAQSEHSHTWPCETHVELDVWSSHPAPKRAQTSGPSGTSCSHVPVLAQNSVIGANPVDEQKPQSPGGGGGTGGGVHTAYWLNVSRHEQTSHSQRWPLNSHASAPAWPIMQLASWFSQTKSNGSP